MSESDFTPEHDGSFRNRTAVTAAARVGCFYCCEIYDSSEITEWTDEDGGELDATAICARCSIDSVIPVKEGVDAAFLAELREKWFRP